MRKRSTLNADWWFQELGWEEKTWAVRRHGGRLGRGPSYRGGQESLLPNSQLGPFSGKTCLRVMCLGQMSALLPFLCMTVCGWVHTRVWGQPE